MAMSNVEFKIEMGEVVAILGPNGAGKSSIMKSTQRKPKTYSATFLRR